METIINLATEESEKSSKKLEIIKVEKSLKMRKQKFSKPQDENILYDGISTEPNNNEKL
jgi:hypothetical protein